MTLALRPSEVWKNIPWTKFQKNIFRLQKRIYRARKRGDIRTVHNLQRLLLRSWSARLIAVRRVSQDNRGKRTAGVDGVASLTPKQRLAYARRLRNLDQAAEPVRRTYLPKSDGSQRPLGIPTMLIRAYQALVKLALEPEWEAVFEPNSYGFSRAAVRTMLSKPSLTSFDLSLNMYSRPTLKSVSIKSTIELC
jgi:RNA-directed DNA polymerase